jgi:hypothetical protein
MAALSTPSEELKPYSLVTHTNTGGPAVMAHGLGMLTHG